MADFLRSYRGMTASWLVGLFCFTSLCFSPPAVALSVTGSFRVPPVHEAAEACDLAKVKLGLASLEDGRPEAAVDVMDSLGDTPLMYAARGGCLEVAAFLVEAGARVDATTYSGWTALLYAANQRHAEVVRYLLANGANTNVKTSNGKTALLEAMAEPLWQKGPAGDGEATIQALLEYGADVNLSGEFGLTPLIAAVLHGDAALVHRLLDKGADVNALDESGRTALLIALESADKEVENLLRKAGAK